MVDIYKYTVESIYIVDFIYIYGGGYVMLRIIYIDRVVIYIYMKKSGGFNDMKYHGSYNKEFIKKTL